MAQCTIGAIIGDIVGSRFTHRFAVPYAAHKKRTIFFLNMTRNNNIIATSYYENI